MNSSNQTIKIFNTSLKKTWVINFMTFFYLAIFIVISIFVGMPIWLYLIFTAVALLFILPSPQLGLGIIIILTMLFERFFTLQPLTIGQEIYKIYPLDIVILISFGALAIDWRKKYLQRAKLPKISLGFPESMLILFIALNTIYLIVSSLDINTDFAVAFSTFKNYAFYALLYFLVIFNVSTKKQLKDLIHLMLVGGVGIIVFIIIGVLSGQGLWTEFTPLSTGGTRLLAGTHAFYLALMSIIGLALLSFKRFWSEGFATVILWIWLFGILGSLMRRLWLALIVGMGIMFFLLPRENKKNNRSYVVKNGLAVISVSCLLLLFINIFPSFNTTGSFYAPLSTLEERLTSITQTQDDTSASWRINLWQSAGKAFAQSPVLGIGTGKTIALNLEDWEAFEEIRNIHNSLLAILVQLGILGFLIFAIFVVSVVATSWKNIFKDRDLAPYYIGIVACLGMFIFVSLFQPYLETNLFGIFFWIFLGLLSTSRNIK